MLTSYLCDWVTEAKCWAVSDASSSILIREAVCTKSNCWLPIELPQKRWEKFRRSVTMERVDTCKAKVDQSCRTPKTAWATFNILLFWSKRIGRDPKFLTLAEPHRSSKLSSIPEAFAVIRIGDIWPAIITHTDLPQNCKSWQSGYQRLQYNELLPTERTTVDQCLLGLNCETHSFHCQTLVYKVQGRGNSINNT